MTEGAFPHYVTLGCGQLRLWQRGSGPDLVVIGGLTLGAEVLANRLGDANPYWRVTVIELPGIGGSSATDNADLAAIAETVAHGIRLAGFANFALAAHETASAFLPQLQRRLGADAVPLTVGLSRALSWKRALSADLDLVPRQDGSHLTVLWHHIRDRLLLRPNDPTQPAKEGEPLPTEQELSDTFVAAAVSPEAYSRLWAASIEGLPELQDMQDSRHVEGLEELGAVIGELKLSSGASGLPATQPLAGNAIWHQTVKTSRGRMHLRRAGAEGTPLLVIPTGGGSSAQFAPVVSGLSNGRQVFSVDYFGNGLSEKLEREVSIATLAEDMAALLDALDLDEVDVWGSHTGALVGLELAVTRPDLVRKAVLEGPVFIDPDFQTDLLDNYFPPMRPDKWGLHLQLVWHWRRDMFMYWPWYRVDRAAARDLGVPTADELHLYAVGILESGPTYDLAYRSAFQYGTAERLKRLERPVLICAGPNDMLVNGVAESEKLKVAGVTTMLTPTTVWWPAPDPAQAASTLKLYDDYLRS